MAVIFQYSEEWQGDLLPNERLLWSGKPAQGFRWSSRDIFFIPFSLFWCGFVVVWIAAASSAGWLFAAFGIPHALVGVYLLVGRYIYDIKLREKTVYAVTNERILIKNGIFKRATTSYAINNLPEIIFTENSDNTCNIAFGRGSSYTVRRQNRTEEPPSFEAIDDGKTVYQLIVQQQLNAN